MLNRFIEAQRGTYIRALREIRRGQKETCWMWFIFPTIKGIGYSETAQYYAIRNVREANEYLKHKILGMRLRRITKELLKLETNDPEEVMGWIDDQKLHASMTLFYQVSGESLFKEVLDKYFGGKFDRTTMKILKEE